jgi:hypothetical protein
MAESIVRTYGLKDPPQYHQENQSTHKYSSDERQSAVEELRHSSASSFMERELEVSKDFELIM